MTKYQYLGDGAKILSSYGNGFLSIYLFDASHGIIKEDIGTFTNFTDYYVQNPYKGKLHRNQIKRIEEYAAQLVIDSKGVVWKKISDTQNAPRPDYCSLGTNPKIIHQGQSNQAFGVQTSIKRTDDFDYLNDYLPSSLSSLKERGIL